MDPAALVPQSYPITLPWGWFEVLMVATFVVHLLFMNTALGAAVIALVHSVTGADRLTPTAKDISKKLPTTLALTVNFGVAPLLFMQVLYGHIFYVSTMLMAAYWMAVIVLVILAYYASYLYDFRYDRLGNWRTLAIAVAVFMLLATSFMFSTSTTMMLSPETWTRWFDNPTGTLLNTADPIFFPRWLHFLTASLAVGGLALAILNERRARRQELGSAGHAGARARVREGMRWFSWASVAQLFFGIWFLLSLKTEVMALFMGGSIGHTVLLLVALAGVATILILGFRGAPYPAAAALVATICVMATMRELVRMAYLAPYFKPGDMQVVSQYSPLVLFLATLAVGLVAVVWVLRQAALAGREG